MSLCCVNIATWFPIVSKFISGASQKSRKLAAEYMKSYIVLWDTLNIKDAIEKLFHIKKYKQMNPTIIIQNNAVSLL